MALALWCLGVGQRVIVTSLYCSLSSFIFLLFFFLKKKKKIVDGFILNRSNPPLPPKEKLIERRKKTNPAATDPDGSGRHPCSCVVFISKIVVMCFI